MPDKVDEVNNQSMGSRGHSPPHCPFLGVFRHAQIVVGNLNVLIQRARERVGYFRNPRIHQDLIVLNEEVVPALEHIHGAVSSLVVIDVVGVDEDVSTFSRQKLSCSVGEESCHGELVRLFRFFSRGLGVDALVGGKYHGLALRNASGSSRDTRERTQRCDGSPGFDVHSILGSAGSGPGRKIVDIVENKDGV